MSTFTLVLLGHIHIYMYKSNTHIHTIEGHKSLQHRGWAFGKVVPPKQPRCPSQ